MRDFPCGPVIKNPPANAGDTRVPGLRRFHMPQDNLGPVPQKRNLCFRAYEPKLLKHMCPRTRALQQECNKRSRGNENPVHCN